MEFLEAIDNKKLPKHIAIIMDGNGRWAKKQKMMRIFGHKNAIKAVRESIELCIDLKINTLSLYCFSTENWNRPKIEIDALMNLLAEVVKKEEKNLRENNVCVKTVGDLTPLPKRAKNALYDLITSTEKNDGLKLALHINYGSRVEIQNMVRIIAKKVQEGSINPDKIKQSHIEQHLQTNELPPLDLLIRTSGEQRVSNFLLWQLAYSELYFTDVLWPDFRKEDLYKAFLFYQGKERRFGKISEQIVS